MKHKDLSSLLLALADSLDDRRQGLTTGVLRVAARELAECRCSDDGESATACRSCGARIPQAPGPGRRRVLCAECSPRRRSAC